MTTVWCEQVLIGGQLHHGVLIDVEHGRFASIDTEPKPGHSINTTSATRLLGLTIPGLANSHSHAFHRALRSRTQTDRGTFWTWRELMYRAASGLDPETYHRLARAVFGEMAMAGVTCVGEFHYLHHQPDGTPYDEQNEMGLALLAAADEVGIRITLLDTLYLHGGLDASGYTAPIGVQNRFSDETVDRWVDRVSGLNPGGGPPTANNPDTRHRIGAAVHSVRAVAPDEMAVVADWAQELGVPMHAHVSEQRAENEACSAHHGSTPLAVLADAGLLSEHFAAVHATHLTKTDISALANSDGSVVMCPTTERDLGDGIGPTGRFADRGVPMALGSDSQAVIDLFEEARALELDERLRSQERGVHSATELLAMATVNGHRSLGWNDAGAIEVGHRADLVTIALDSVRTAGTSPDVSVEATVFAATAADITDVHVGGRHVVADGRHLGIDVVAELDASIKELMDDDSR